MGQLQTSPIHTIPHDHEYTNVIRWAAEVAARPAVQRGRMVNASRGEPHEILRERHDASDFELRTQDKIGEAE